MATEQLVDEDAPTTINGLTLRPSVRKRWVEALRSGKYEQGKARLRKGDSFCCLGVLCDLAGEDGLGVWDEMDSFVTEAESWTQTSAYLPAPPVIEWAGYASNELSPWKTTIPSKMGANSEYLYGHNDDGSTFAEIADIIEGTA